MADNTENHEYNTPAEGTTNWDVPLNANFDGLDTDVEVRDADANRSQYTPKDGALFRATDTGNLYVGDGSTWTLLDIGGRSFSAEELTGGVTGGSGAITNLVGANLSVDSDGNLNATSGNTGSGDSPYINVAGMSGSDLSAKVSNALDALGRGNGGKLVVPDNGSSWSWGSDLTIDPTNYDGLELEFHGEIEYDGGGYALTFDTGGDLGGQLNGRLLKITGGRWTASGSPDGAWRFVDVFHAHIEPRWMDGWANGSDGACLTFENVNNWSESNYISGSFDNCDYAIHFRTDNLSGGTTSFQDTVIEHTHVENANDSAYRFGDPGNPADLANMCMIAPRAFNHSDGCRAFYFNGRFDGGLILAPEVEEFASNTTKYETGPNMNGPTPLILGGNTDDPGQVGPSTEVDRYNWGHRVPRISSPATSTSGSSVVDIQDVGKSEVSYERGGNWDFN